MNFAREQGITHYYEVGCMGVEHALLPEQGVVGAGDLIIGADSHTCTYGALGAFATAWAPPTPAWGTPPGVRGSRCPSRFCSRSKASWLPASTGKDVILHIIA